MEWGLGSFGFTIFWPVVMGYVNPVVSIVRRPRRLKPLL